MEIHKNAIMCQKTWNGNIPDISPYSTHDNLVRYHSHEGIPKSSRNTQISPDKRWLEQLAARSVLSNFPSSPPYKNSQKSKLPQHHPHRASDIQKQNRFVASFSSMSLNTSWVSWPVASFECVAVLPKAVASLSRKLQGDVKKCMVFAEGPLL